MATISVDGRTALVQYADLVMHLRDFLDRCIEADAQAAKALAAQPLLNALILVAERRYWASKAGWRKCPRVWTLRDVKRVSGHAAGDCRAAIALNWLRSGDAEPRHERLFREAIDEARRDGTAAVVAPALNELREAFDRLLTEANSIAQGEGDRREFEVALLGVHRAMEPVKQFTRPGGGDNESGEMLSPSGGHGQTPPLPLAPIVDGDTVTFDGKVYADRNSSDIEFIETMLQGRGEFIACGIAHVQERVIDKLPAPIAALVQQAGKKGPRRFDPSKVRFE